MPGGSARHGALSFGGVSAGSAIPAPFPGPDHAGDWTPTMRTLFPSAMLAFLSISTCASTPGHSAAIELSPERLEAVNTRIEMVEYRGRRALQLLPLPGGGDSNDVMLAILNDLQFEDGTIEVELAGAPRPDAGPEMRGFIGIAFRVHSRDRRWDCFYLRPANGRADDQLRRNHSLQYVSAPDYGWKRLRTEHQGMYESYADLVPGEWTGVKIRVSGTKAMLYVNGSSQPSLIVNDLKSGVRSGAIALWSHPSTEGYFSNLRVSSSPREP